MSNLEIARSTGRVGPTGRIPRQLLFALEFTFLFIHSFSFSQNLHLLQTLVFSLLTTSISIPSPTSLLSPISSSPSNFLHSFSFYPSFTQKKNSENFHLFSLSLPFTFLSNSSMSRPSKRRQNSRGESSTRIPPDSNFPEVLLEAVLLLICLTMRHESSLLPSCCNEVIAEFSLGGDLL